MKNDNRTEEMRKIKDEVLNLKESPLYKERIKNKALPVIGEGSHNARIMFIGEAPGKNEAETGRPFCGAAGNVLDKLLESISLDRKEVYVTNVVKDRPTSNRDPLPEEIKLYAPFLDRQIDIIQPKVIATLGRFSMGYIMRKFGLESELQSISKMHGKVFEAKARYGLVRILPLYHPAVALYNGSEMDTLKKDFGLLKKFIS
ncbi:MAG: uracil-DNA glycosylase [Candidatus Niyogibacteria bacterium CG10_big_fil_rev_8_21_14_0_10_46_36]|uniref:Type-4 uracil-DNA glycosylase n=1 Tax=Candidatus Niyogibacteria bacterium CG10_big_fil_rev_8_21_14_0_10_46_36 TaxID=1974726 RepID=A0A2H0TD98_9BACT|nr:MAG: uracil-DNA glycosylase [Candidatus Niyogibacteria bacterium CG10_big_fil_rev_8_21_14_0_10_46_36]